MIPASLMMPHFFKGYRHALTIALFKVAGDDVWTHASGGTCGG
jgi:hypothetical protein